MICESDGVIRVYDHAAKKSAQIGKHSKVSCLKMSSDGTLAASVGADGHLQIYSVKDKKQLDSIKVAAPGQSLGFDWLPEGETLVISGKNTVGFCSE